MPARVTKDRSWLFAVLVGAVAVRIGLWLAYEPARYPDTGTYLSFAAQLRALDLSAYTGWRTPGYPALLALIGNHDRLVWLVQSVMGIATSALLFAIVVRSTRSGPAGAVAALAHTLALNQLFYEPAILAETLSTFLLVFTMYAAQSASVKHWPSTAAAGIGVLNTVLALTRPLYVVVVPVVAFVIVLTRRSRGLAPAVILLITVASGVIAWSAVNKATLGYFGMTTLVGYNLSNHSGRMIERASDEFAAIRDIYLKHRAERAQAGKSHAMTIFDAREELKSSTGMSDVELSRQFTKLSLTLFAAYPTAYLESVAVAWVSFWAVPNPMRKENFHSAKVAGIFDAIWSVENWVLRAAYALFLLLALPTLWTAWVRMGAKVPGWNCPAVLVATVLASSVLQALLEYGENPRYAIPTQSLAMAAVVIVVFRLTHRRAPGPGLPDPAS